jgi:hypothetical protein
MNWPAPWKPRRPESADDALLAEFQREAAPNHILSGVPLRTISTGDADNVLFEFLDGSGRLAAVHLTFSRNRETDERWPDTQVYNDWAHFEREGSEF